MLSYEESRHCFVSWLTKSVAATPAILPKRHPVRASDPRPCQLQRYGESPACMQAPSFCDLPQLQLYQINSTPTSMRFRPQTLPATMLQ